jgi:hypothetical protein
MRLVIKNLIQLCLRTLVFSIVLRHSNYNNRIISIEGTFFWDTLYIVFINTFYKIDKQKCGFLSELGNWVFCRRGFCRRGFCHVEVLSWIRVISTLYNLCKIHKWCPLVPSAIMVLIMLQSWLHLGSGIWFNTLVVCEGSTYHEIIEPDYTSYNPYTVSKFASVTSTN